MYFIPVPCRQFCYKQKANSDSEFSTEQQNAGTSALTKKKNIHNVTSNLKISRKLQPLSSRSEIQSMVFMFVTLLPNVALFTYTVWEHIWISKRCIEIASPAEEISWKRRILLNKHLYAQHYAKSYMLPWEHKSTSFAFFIYL